MEDDDGLLTAGFAIDTHNAFSELAAVDRAMDEMVAGVLSGAGRVEQAVGGMVNGGPAIASFRAIGSSANREMAELTRTRNTAEKAAERMIYALEREATTFGKSRAQIRDMRTEMKAVAADSAGLTEAAIRLRAANAEMQRLEGGTGQLGKTSRLARGDMLNLGYQLNDVAVSLASGQKPLTVFLQQGAQIGQIAASSGVGFNGMAASIGALLIPLAPAIALVGAAAGGFALFNRAVSDGIDTQPMIDSLGLTRDEIKKLENTAVTSGDVIAGTFQVLAQRVDFDMSAVKGYFGDAMDFLTVAGRRTLASLYTTFVGTFSAISEVVRGAWAGKGVGEIMDAAGKAYDRTFNQANASLKRFGADVTKQVAANKLADLQRQAAELKLDRSATTPKVDRRAEQLARDAEAMEAQIRNQYALAAAYEVSGGAALIAEARVKAESDAIKKRGDVEQFVSRQVQLSIATRVMDAAKASAGMRDQARVQTEINAMISEGVIPAERAAQFVGERIAELPLLAAIEAAQQRGLKTEAENATKALESQRDAQTRLRAAATGEFFAKADADADRQLAVLREEMRLIGATNMERVRGMATIRATQELQAKGMPLGTPYAEKFVADQVKIATTTEGIAAAQRSLNDALSFTSDRLDLIANNVANAGRGMADAFGEAGRAIGDMASIYTGFHADRARLDQEHQAKLVEFAGNEAALARENTKFALATSARQVGLYGDMTAAAKGFFKENSGGYQVLATAEKAFRAVEFAMSVRSIAQDAAETASSIAKSGARAAAGAVEAVVNAIKSLPFPLNLAAGAATVGALASIGVAIGGGFGGGGRKPAPANTGTGTVFGDSDAKSESIRRSIDALREVDTLTNTFAREMAASLKSIDSQIGGFAALVVRTGDVNADMGLTEGFKKNLIGSVLGSIPLVGGLLGSLFGSKTEVTGSGLFGGPQSLGSINSRGFDASYYSDVQKTSKFLGITTGKKSSTQFTGADAGLENQFTLILRQFSDAVADAAVPLGMATADVERRINGFVVNIGRIDLKGLTGAEIQEKLGAIFGAAADNIANAAYPGLSRFQKVGEGAFETMVRVASTVEAVTNSLDQLGFGARAIGLDAKVGLANRFDSLSAMTDATDAYFEGFYTREEQAAAKTADLGRVFGSLNLAMPDTLAGFRGLVEAQDLTSAAGQSTYATLLQLAPAFADLASAMTGAKSAADILGERQDLERKLLEMQGDTAAIRALDLAKLDASNRGLQGQIYALQDAQEAARAADELRQAWSSVGDGIMDEVRRIRGLSDAETGGEFATLQGRFNAANTAARSGDMDAAKLLPGLSQALLNAASLVATSRQELDRVQAQTASVLEVTSASLGQLTGRATNPMDALNAAAAAQQGAATPGPANDAYEAGLRVLREELAALRADINSGNAAIAANTGKTARTLENVTTATGGEAISVAYAA